MRLSHFRISAALVGLVPTTIVGFALLANTQIEPARAAAMELYKVAGGRFDGIVNLTGFRAGY